ncbi:uncharacterized protein LOC120354674 [Nilaparvata lugens]|uniref:uncharacterized protein LOC120354674 n=1 Tax=Nilaparvata lugens TaxID=108931 RepID=UPI00193C8B23|nr:uncharacterized protein LOC120354674 [Nilaparvata lugens]
MSPSNAKWTTFIPKERESFKVFLIPYKSSIWFPAAARSAEPYHCCRALNNTRYAFSRVGRVWLPCRCLHCSSRRPHWTLVSVQDADSVQIKAMSAFGGRDFNAMTINILRHSLTGEAAQQFSITTGKMRNFPAKNTFSGTKICCSIFARSNDRRDTSFRDISKFV